MGDGLSASEIAVEVLSDFLLRRVHSLEHPDALGRYVALVAARRAKRRSRFEHRSVVHDMDLYGNDSRTVEDAVHYRRLLPSLEACLAKLRPKAVQVIKLRYHAGLSNEAIGNLVGGSKQYIGKLLQRCLRSLRKCLTTQLARRSDSHRDAEG
jgi:RNA polymerase sigma factor (sigma-70 family)